jgi:hypothetical protein
MGELPLLSARKFARCREIGAFSAGAAPRKGASALGTIRESGIGAAMETALMHSIRSALTSPPSGSARSWEASTASGWLATFEPITSQGSNPVTRSHPAAQSQVVAKRRRMQGEPGRSRGSDGADASIAALRTNFLAISNISFLIFRTSRTDIMNAWGP